MDEKQITTRANGNVSLTDREREKIKQVFEAGTAENTRRAHRGDLRQFWEWAGEKYGAAESYPVGLDMLTAYVANHLERHSVRTVERRIGSLSVAHRLQGVPDHANPCRDSRVRELLKAAKRAAVKEGNGPRKKRALTVDVLERLLSTCDDTPIGIRDRAILMVGFGSGGRRRSELAAFCVEDLEQVEGGYTITLRSSKTDQIGEGATLPIIGRAGAALSEWLQVSSITSGPLFRSLTRWGALGASISDKAINLMVKERARKAGLNPDEFGAHSLRSGFVTTAGERGIPAQQAMALSRHRSAKVFNGYYQSGDVLNNPAGKMLGMGA